MCLSKSILLSLVIVRFEYFSIKVISRFFVPACVYTYVCVCAWHYWLVMDQNLSASIKQLTVTLLEWISSLQPSDARMCISKLSYPTGYPWLPLVQIYKHLSPVRQRAIIWTNVGLLSVRPQGTFPHWNLNLNSKVPLKKIHLKMSSAKRRPSCPSLNVLTLMFYPSHFIFQFSYICAYCRYLFVFIVRATLIHFYSALILASEETGCLVYPSADCCFSRTGRGLFCF